MPYPVQVNDYKHQYIFHNNTSTSNLEVSLTIYVFIGIVYLCICGMGLHHLPQACLNYYNRNNNHNQNTNNQYTNNQNTNNQNTNTRNNTIQYNHSRKQINKTKKDTVIVDVCESDDEQLPGYNEVCGN